jgi:hypothetical protein
MNGVSPSISSKKPGWLVRTAPSAHEYSSLSWSVPFLDAGFNSLGNKDTSPVSMNRLKSSIVNAYSLPFSLSKIKPTPFRGVPKSVSTENSAWVTIYVFPLSHFEVKGRTRSTAFFAFGRQMTSNSFTLFGALSLNVQLRDQSRPRFALRPLPIRRRFHSYRIARQRAAQSLPAQRTYLQSSRKCLKKSPRPHSKIDKVDFSTEASGKLQADSVILSERTISTIRWPSNEDSF